jgi:hypothetical protein
MRVPARRVTAISVFALLACTSWLAACATPDPVTVRYDEREDLSALRTWDWIEGDAVLVRAPSHDAAQIEAELSDLVARALAERGLVRDPGRGALRVAALLVVYRSHQPFRRARALQTVYSHHDTGNYEVQADEVERRPVDRMRLSIFLTAAAQERILWQAELEEQHPGDFSGHLDDAVAKVLGEFPPRVAQQVPAR